VKHRGISHVTRLYVKVLAPNLPIFVPNLLAYNDLMSQHFNLILEYLKRLVVVQLTFRLLVFFSQG
jgi:hypothetical protein